MGLLEDVERDLKRAEDLLDKEQEDIESLEQEEMEKERNPTKAIVEALEDAHEESEELADEPIFTDSMK